MASAAATRQRTVRTPARSARTRPPNRTALRVQGGAVALPRRGVSGLGQIARLPDTPFVAMLARSRLWIGLLALLLFGIVALNVVVMQLNAGIGSMAERSHSLEQQNGDLRAELAKLTVPDRVIRTAAAKGMVTPPSQSLRYIDRYPKPTLVQRNAAENAASFGGRAQK